MRPLSRLLVVLILCLVSTAVLGEPAQAADGGAYITLSPSQRIPGENVTVRGYNFTASRWVDIYYDVDGDDEWSEAEWIEDEKTDDDGHFEVSFTIPESHTGSHGVLAEDQEGRRTFENFVVKPGLTVYPEEGTVGTNVTVEGHGFAEDEEEIEVRYYSGSDHTTVAENIEADENGNWEEVFRIPASAQGSHRMDAKGNDSSYTEVHDITFEVTAGISLDRYSGSVGENITMTGNGFVAGERDIKILLAGEVMETEPDIIRADDTGSWNGTFEVPEMPTDEYSVTAEGEFTDKEDLDELIFEIRPGLLLSPNQGHVGTNLTVTGGGFTAGENVVIKYTGSQQATATISGSGSFTAVFSVPESQHGVRYVTAEVDGTVEATATFTMESQAPDVPDLISPTNGARVGLIGRRATPTFEWSAVSDDSGVHYSLQIATSDDFKESSMIASATRLTETNYTLDRALPYGTYYWTVQAVDGAENESGWTATGSFRIGLLPLWAFIVAIVAIAAGIGAAVYFFVIRRKTYYY